MTFYLATIIIIGLLMIAMTLHVLTYSGFNKVQKGWFAGTFISLFFCCFAEYAVHCGEYDVAFKIPLTILTVIQFSVSPVLAMLFAGALGLKKQRTVALVFLAITLITQTICAPFGWIFYFNDDGYFRGQYFIIYEIFYFVSLLYLIVMLAIAGRRFHNRDSVTIIMILVILVAGILPMTFYQLHVSYIAIGVAACLCYIYYNDLVQQDTKAELLSNQEKVNSMQGHIITGMASLIESRDTDTGEHVIRTSYYCKTLAEDCVQEGVFLDKINDTFIDYIYRLAPLHDVGKIVVSDQVLRKPGKLTSEEFEEIKKHAAMGGEVIRKILEGITDEEYINFAADIATYHHERWDGTGYPKQLKGTEIPLSARIMAIADVYDALTSKRCYKDEMPPEEAFETIKSESGTHFDPLLVEVFLHHKDKYLKFIGGGNKQNESNN